MLSLEVTSEGGAAEILRDAVRRLEDPQQLLDTLGKRLVAAFRRHITTQRDPKGKQHAPRKEKKRGSFNRSPLPPAIFDDLTYRVTGPNSVEAGSTLDYAPFHDLGTSVIPARSFIGISDETERELDSDTRTFLNAAFNR